MKTTTVLAIVLVMIVPAAGSEPKGATPELKSLHGTMIMMLSDKEGLPFEIWAKGNDVRTEFNGNTQKIISIQRGNTIYTYGDRASSGMRQVVLNGLGSIGLIKQIEEVKARGKKTDVHEIEGKQYQVYEYDINLPEEVAIVFLSVETSLPSYWHGVVKPGDNTASTQRMLFRNMEANVVVPDELFNIPRNVNFSDAPDKSLPKNKQPNDSAATVIDQVQADQPGTLFVVTSARVTVKSGEKVLSTCRPGDVLRLSKKQKDWLLVQTPSVKGWVHVKDVVPLEKAYIHFSTLIQKNPRNVEALCGRGRFLIWLVENTSQVKGLPKGSSALLSGLALADFERAAQYGTSVDVLVGRGAARGLRGEYSESLVDFNAAVKLDPQCLDAIRHRALTLIKLNQSDAAIADCDQLIRLDAKNAEAHSLRCFALGLKGKWDAAILEGDLAIQTDPTLASAYVGRGAAWAGKGNYARAEADYDEAIRLGEDSARVGRARIYYQHGKPREAVADLNVIVALHPDDPKSLFQRGTILLQLDDLDGAIADLSRVIELRPTADAHANRGAAWAAKNEAHKAIEDFSTAVRLDPSIPSNYQNRARLLVQLNQYPQAIADLNKFISIVPDDPSAFISRGMARHFSGEHDDAIADFNTAIKLAPKESYAYVCRGSVWNQKQDFDRAIADFNRAIELNPNTAEAYSYRGVAWHQQNNAKNALSDFNAAVSLDPSSDIARVNRGSYWLSKKEYSNAITDLREAIRLNPSRAAVLNQLAWILATAPDSQARNAEEAVKLAKRACELTNWKDHDYLSTLAAAYAEAGDYQAADKWQANALQAAPNDVKEVARKRLDLFRNKQPYRDEPLAETTAPK